jgi:hypothetical protein
MNVNLIKAMENLSPFPISSPEQPPCARTSQKKLSTQISGFLCNSCPALIFVVMAKVCSD